MTKANTPEWNVGIFLRLLCLGPAVVAENETEVTKASIPKFSRGLHRDAENANQIFSRDTLQYH